MTLCDDDDDDNVFKYIVSSSDFTASYGRTVGG